MRQIVLVIHNVRSCQNVGAMLRTAEGLGISEVILTGYTPYPKLRYDPRLPHLAAQIDKRITKTSLGAEKFINWRRYEAIEPIMVNLKRQKYVIAALEQTEKSTNLSDYDPPQKLAIIVGNEVTGVELGVLVKCDLTLEIPMAGQKESFNVAAAAAMVLYHCITR